MPMAKWANLTSLLRQQKLHCIATSLVRSTNFTNKKEILRFGCAAAQNDGFVLSRAKREILRFGCAVAQNDELASSRRGGFRGKKCQIILKGFFF